ncbi:MAG: DsrE/DsrF/DrsH-like family protein [Actinomycetota bacterium]
MGESETPGKLALVAWSDDLDKAWPVLILATTGVAAGMDVSIFFTFWGLRLLQRNDKRMTGKNWMQKMLSIFNRGGADNLKLHKLNFAGMGPWMMHKLAKEHGVASPQELLELAREAGVRLVPCQMTMDLMGISREDMIDGIEQPAGAMSAILEMQEAKATLFI